MSIGLREGSMAAGRAAPASHIPDPLWVPSRCISGQHLRSACYFGEVLRSVTASSHADASFIERLP